MNTHTNVQNEAVPIHTRSQCSGELRSCLELQRLSETASNWAQVGRCQAGRPAKAVPVRQDGRRPEQSGSKRVVHSHA